MMICAEAVKTMLYCVTVVILMFTITDTISTCVKARYDYWKEYDKGITDNLNKQLEYNKLKK